MSPDPLSVHAAGADLNVYAYVGGRVASHVDPWGLDAMPIPSAPPEGPPDATYTHDNGTTVSMWCGGCNGGESFGAPAGAPMEAGAIGMPDYLERQPGSGPAAGPSAASKALLGTEEDVVDRRDPEFREGQNAAGRYAAAVLALLHAARAASLASTAAEAALLRAAGRLLRPAAGAAGAAGAAQKAGACSGKGCAGSLRFAANDLVYGPTAGGQLRSLQQRAGGRLLSDVPGKLPSQEWIDFSKQTLRAHVGGGGTVHFDMTNMADIPGTISGTGSHANTITGAELRFLQQNWAFFQGHVLFYNFNVSSTPVAAPWH